ncbi:MAG: hypothetical protein LIP16_12540 [Clostridium sp.]|nr:hypothetical protein [Clostridium sp.]
MIYNLPVYNIKAIDNPGGKQECYNTENHREGKGIYRKKAMNIIKQIKYRDYSGDGHRHRSVDVCTDNRIKNTAY